MKNKKQGKGKGKQGSKSTNTSNQNRKSLGDFKFEIGSTKSSDYVDVKDHLINKIRKDFDYGDDIAIARL